MRMASAMPWVITHLYSKGKTMKIQTAACGLLLSVMVVACGGGGGGGTTAPVVYTVPTPSLNAQASHYRAVTDNLGGTWNLTSVSTVYAVNADGSYSVKASDPNVQVQPVNGNNYFIVAADTTVDSTGLVVTNNITGVVCTGAVVGTTSGKSLQVGQTWSNTTTTTCSNAPSAPTSVAITGSVLALESVTVPAGNFTALKILRTLVSQNNSGGNLTETVTDWLDTVSGQTVKTTDTLAFSGTLPTGSYPVSRTIVLTPTYTRPAVVASTTGAHWARDIVDNSTPAVQIHLIYDDYVTAVSPNGFYTLDELDTTGAPVLVGSSTYEVKSLTIRLNADHQTVSTVGRDNAAGNDCTYTPHGSGVVYPISVGVQWNNSFTQSCLDGTALSTVQTGSVAGVEPVTVPAGTFTAARLESTIVSTNTTSGLVTTATVIVWANVLDGKVVKRAFSFAYSGSVPARSLPISTIETLQ